MSAITSYHAHIYFDAAQACGSDLPRHGRSLA